VGDSGSINATPGGRFHSASRIEAVRRPCFPPE
jgi:hypothetical protein